MVRGGGDFGRCCGECGWWCMEVVIVGGDMVNAVGGACWW